MEDKKETEVWRVKLLCSLAVTWFSCTQRKINELTQLTANQFGQTFEYEACINCAVSEPALIF